MKTSAKILIGVSAVAALYVAWELFVAVKENKTGNSDSGGDNATSPDDYDTYLKALGTSSGTGASAAKKSSYYSAIQNVGTVFTWPIQLIAKLTGASASSSTTGATSATGSASFSYSTVAKTASNFPVQYGSRNGAVAYLQKVYNAYAKNNSLSAIDQDGIYGNNTATALAALATAMYQNGLSIDYIKKNIMSVDTNGRCVITQSQFKNWEKAISTLHLSV